MDEFLKNELEGVPPGVKRAVLSQIENAVRASRVAIYHDKPDDINLRCITICARIASALEFLTDFKRNIH